MAFNIEKAKRDGHSDQEIRGYLAKSGRAPDEIEAIMHRHGDTYARISHYAKPALEFGGMTGGQMLGGGLGAATSPTTGPVGPMVGRVAGGTAGNVLGGMAGDTIRSLMGTQDPSQILSNVPGELKEGAALSGVGEAAGLAAKGLGVFKNLISKDAGIAKGAADIGEATTGQAGQRFRDLAHNPRAILPRWLGGYPGKGRAWTNFVDTAAKEGVSPNYHEWTGVPTEEIKKFADETWQYMKLGGKISKQEAVSLLSAVREIAGSEEPRMYKYYDQIKKGALAAIGKAMPETAQAYGDYAKSRLASGFHSPGFGLMAKIPDSEKAAGHRWFYELRRALPLVAGAATGAATGSPAMALGIGALGSPLAMGMIPAAMGAMTKPRFVTGALKAVRALQDQGQ